MVGSKLAKHSCRFNESLILLDHQLSDGTIWCSIFRFLSTSFKTIQKIPVFVFQFLVSFFLPTWQHSRNFKEFPDESMWIFMFLGLPQASASSSPSWDPQHSGMVHQSILGIDIWKSQRWKGCRIIHQKKKKKKKKGRKRNTWKNILSSIRIHKTVSIWIWRIYSDLIRNQFTKR